MAPERRCTLSVIDIERIWMHCRSCDGEFTYPTTEELFLMPSNCPVCSQTWYETAVLDPNRPAKSFKHLGSLIHVIQQGAKRGEHSALLFEMRLEVADDILDSLEDLD